MLQNHQYQHIVGGKTKYFYAKWLYITEYEVVRALIVVILRLHSFYFFRERLFVFFIYKVQSNLALRLAFN